TWSARGLVLAVPEAEADPRPPPPGGLGHAVLPRALAGPAPHQEGARRAGESRRRARPPGAGEGAAGRPARDQAADDPRWRPQDAVAVPGHTVPPVAVEVGADRVERGVVALAQQLDHLPHGPRPVVRREAPPRVEAGLRERAAVDRQVVLAPLHRVEQLLE